MRWHGFTEEDDTWEPVGNIPSTFVRAYDRGTVRWRRLIRRVHRPVIRKKCTSACTEIASGDTACFAQ